MEIQNQKQLDLVLKYKRVFDSEDARAVLLDLMETFNIFGGTYSSDPNAMYFKEGERSVVRYIMGKIDMDYEEFRKAIKELEEDF